MGFNKSLMSCVYHDCIIQKSFIALKISCAPPSHSSSPQAPGNLWSLHCLCSFVFSWVLIELESYKYVVILSCLLSLNIHLYFLCVLWELNDLFLFYQWMLVHCKDIQQFICSPFEEHLVCFQFWQLCIKLSKTCICRFLCMDISFQLMG